MSGRPAPLSALRLTRLLIGLRFRLLWNAVRGSQAGRARAGGAGARGGAPALALIMGVVTAVAYVGLFSQAFAVMVTTAGAATQVAALSLVVGTIVLGALAAKAAASDGLVAGSPENEFLLTRPLSLPALALARSLAGAITDPLGALFIFPILIAAALTWQLGPSAWAVAALTSMILQIAISSAAQTVQIIVVRYVRARRRRLAWVGLRLLASLALAALWMTGTWVLRAPRTLARAAARLGDSPWLAPGASIVAPLAALRDGHGATMAVVASLVWLAAVTAVVLAVSFLIARRAGLHGWEEAGAPWAEAAPRGAAATARPLTAATKDLRLLLRDRSQLLALVAMPIIFVGLQIFGAAGWGWSTASLHRVSFLSFSLCLYTATIGPLAHMQAERRAFWILRTVPVSLGRLMAAKARTWALLLGGLAGAVFLALSAGVPGAANGERVELALLVMAGAAGMAFIAVGLACLAADLSDDQRPAIGPSTIYLFLLVGGLYNLVLAGDGEARLRGLILYALVIFAYWVSGLEQARACLDPEVSRRRVLRLADAATLVLLGDLGRRAALAGAGAAAAGELDGPERAVLRAAIEAGVTGLIGLAAALYLLRRPRGRPRLSMAASSALALAAGAAVAFILRAPGGVPALRALVPGSALTPAAVAGAAGRWLSLAALLLAGAPLVLGEELLFRATLQRALEDRTRGRPVGRAAAALATAVVAVVATGGALQIAIASHAMASAVRAATGRTSASFLARLALLAGLAVAAVAV